MKSFQSISVAVSVAAAILALCISGASSPVFAMYSTMETGDLVNEGDYKVTGYGHWILEGYFGGFNAQGAFDTYATDSSSFRFNLATGNISFLVGGSYKWIPIPDYEDQPALGIIGSATFAQFNGESIISFQGKGIVSKKFELEFGNVTPFGALPVGITFYDGEVQYPLNLSLGGELEFSEIENLAFISEVSFDIHESYSFFNFGVSYDF